MTTTPTTNLRALPGIPTTVDAKTLEKNSNLKALITTQLKDSGVIRSNSPMLLSVGVGGIAKMVRPELEKLRERDGDTLQMADVARVVDNATHEQQAKASRRRSLWIGGGIGVGAMILGGAATWGVNQAFGGLGSWIGHAMHTDGTVLGAGIQAAFSPVMISVIGMFVGACASFINSNVSTPLQAFIIRQAMRGSPDQFNFDPKLRADYLHSWAVEQTVDGRTLGMRYAIMLHNNGLILPMREIKNEMRAFRTETDPAKKQAALETAADHLSGTLVHNETMWFYVTPQSEDLFKFIMLLLWPYLRGCSPDELRALGEATLKRVRETRPADDSPGRASLDESVKNFYEPYLEKLLNPPASKSIAQPQLTVAAHAG